MKRRHRLRAARGIHGLLAALILTTAPPRMALAQPPETPPPDDAYLDQTARRLVLGARAAHAATRPAIGAHTALVRERLSFNAPTGRHDRPWIRGERVLQARWSRNAPAVVDLLEQDFRHPGLGPTQPRYFRVLRADHLPVDPLSDPFTLGLAPFMGGDAAAIAVHSPLGPDAEQYYQFRSNGNTTLQLESGETIETVAVTAIPRYRSIRLVAAIMWIDPETFGLVRTAYRPAKRIDQEITGALREADGWWLGLNVTVDDTISAAQSAKQPGWFGQLINETFTAVLLGIETDISSVIVDFAPQSQMRHWLPRRAQWTGYTGIESVSATGSVVPTLPFAIDWTMDAADGAEGEDDPLPPPLAANALSGLAPDTRDLANTLAGIGNGDAGDAGEAASPWYIYPPIWTLNLVRYNPVEGVSIGAQMRRDFGWWRSVLTVRAATREWKEVPDMDLTFQRDRPGLRTQLSAYRALRTGALGAGGIDGFPLPVILDGDSADFHWSTGTSLRFLSGSGERFGFSLSFFAENDEEVETGDGHDDVVEAGSAGDDEPGHQRTRFGAALEWKPWWGGLGRETIGVGGTVSVRASAGDNHHVRTMVEGALLLPLAARISLGLQAGWADVSGDPAHKDLWDLGSTGAWLRGHEEAIETSRAWMARADLQFPVRYARLSLFGDLASAEGENYYAAGAGLVLLDGLLRVDAAQGFRVGHIRLVDDRGGKGGPEPVLRFHVLVDNLF